MRIAHVVHRYPPALGGAEAYFARLSRYLVDQGEEIEVLTTNALDLEAFWSPGARTLSAGAEVHDGVTVRRFPIQHRFGQRYWRKLLSLIPGPRLQAFHLPCNPRTPEMWRACGRPQGFDVVHAAALPYAYPILSAMRLAKACKAPFFLTPFLHLGDERTRRAYLAPAMRYLLYAADLLFVQTRIERTALLDIGIPAERIVLQGLGVDPAECTGGDREAARARWHLPADTVVIGHLANKSVEKGTVDLLRAAELLWRRGVECRLLLAGPEMPNFQRFWSNFPFQDRVCKLDVLSEAEKRDFYAACDVFALPSRSDSFGLVLLEAWANGVPCVGYRAGGVAEVIHHERDGLLVECGAIESLGSSLGSLIRDASLRRTLGERGRDRVVSECAWRPRLDLVRRAYSSRSRLSASAHSTARSPAPAPGEPAACGTG